MPVNLEPFPPLSACQGVPPCVRRSGCPVVQPAKPVAAQGGDSPASSTLHCCGPFPCPRQRGCMPPLCRPCLALLMGAPPKAEGGPVVVASFRHDCDTTRSDDQIQHAVPPRARKHGSKAFARLPPTSATHDACLTLFRRAVVRLARWRWRQQPVRVTAGNTTFTATVPGHWSLPSTASCLSA